MVYDRVVSMYPPQGPGPLWSHCFYVPSSGSGTIMVALFLCTLLRVRDCYGRIVSMYPPQGPGLL